MDAPALTLTLQPDNPLNTTLSSDGRPLYTVSATRTARGSAIRVSDASGANVATLETSDLGWGSSKVRVGEDKSVAYGKWLSKSIMPFGRDVTMKDKRGRKYKWRENRARGTLALYTAEQTAFPIASFRRTLTDEGGLVATLSLEGQAQEIRDQVVASFVFLERERRARERAIENKAASETRAQVSFGVS